MKGYHTSSFAIDDQVSPPIRGFHARGDIRLVGDALAMVIDTLETA